MTTLQRDVLQDLDNEIFHQRQQLKQRIMSSGGTPSHKLRVKLSSLEKECNQLEYAYLMEREECQGENRRLADELNANIQISETKIGELVSDHSERLLELRGEIEACLATQEALASRAPQLEREMEALKSAEAAHALKRTTVDGLREERDRLRQAVETECARKEEELQRVKEGIDAVEALFDSESDQLGHTVQAMEKRVRELDRELCNARQEYVSSIAQCRRRDEELSAKVQEEAYKVQKEVSAQRRSLQALARKESDKIRENEDKISQLKEEKQKEMKELRNYWSTRKKELDDALSTARGRLNAIEEEKNKVSKENKENLKKLERSCRFIEDLLKEKGQCDSSGFHNGPLWISRSSTNLNLNGIKLAGDHKVEDGPHNQLENVLAPQPLVRSTTPDGRRRQVNSEPNQEILASKVLLVQEENEKLRKRAEDLKKMNRAKEVSDLHDALMTKKAERNSLAAKVCTERIRQVDEGKVLNELETLKKDIALRKKIKADEVQELKQEFQELEKEIEEVRHQHQKERQMREDKIKLLREQLENEREKAKLSLAGLQGKSSSKSYLWPTPATKVVQQGAVKETDDVVELVSQTNSSTDNSVHSSEVNKNWNEIERRLDMIKDRRNKNHNN